MKYLLDKLLNQDELVIKWHRKITKKGNRDYVAGEEAVLVLDSIDFQIALREIYERVNFELIEE